VLGNCVRVFQPDLVNLYGCTIGDDTKIGAFVEVQKNAVVGARCKISSHTFVCEGVTIEDEVFVGHGVVFINDKQLRACTEGQLRTAADGRLVSAEVEECDSTDGAVFVRVPAWPICRDSETKSDDHTGTRRCRRPAVGLCKSLSAPRPAFHRTDRSALSTVVRR
jgi:acetyltransferase-like isoleucine patch superfamily enzyme